MLNAQYRVVVQPTDLEKWGKKRFLVSVNTLDLYIGPHNANTAFLKASKLKTDKLRLKFRSFGIVDIYLK